MRWTQPQSPRRVGLLCCAVLWLSVGAAPAQAAPVEELVFVAPTNHTMPLARFDGDKLQDGILKDLGEAIAQRLGLRARFLPQPSKRVGVALTEGKADVLCYVLPRWVEGSFNWSVPVIPNAGVVAARDEVPALQSLGQLADTPMGTVLGYNYPHFQQALGARFRREDAPTMELNLRKLAVGRVRYAITEQTTLAYFQRHEPAAKLKAALTLTPFNTQCAFSKLSRIPFAQANKAIAALVADGSVERILARYR